MNDTQPESTGDATPAPSAPLVPRRRRPRYSGKNPRRFDQKYKELNPDKYPETLAKILASGKTPAGMHRPICVPEILELLHPQPGETGVDATLGYGGHARELLSRILPGGRLIALDTDPIELPKTEARLRNEGYGPEILTVHHSNYAGLPKILQAVGIAGVDFLLADLGCSSMQLDDPARGFTFKAHGPLDLRMNPQKGQSAATLLGRISEEKLTALLQDNADEPHATLLAAAMVRARVEPIETTTALVRIIKDALPPAVQKSEGDTPIRRVFQALRIAVNEEFSALDSLLRSLPHCLKPNARVAILTFHSGEDRRVKKAFQAGLREGLYQSIAEEVIRPSAEEVYGNPRAASAKLRWAIR